MDFFQIESSWKQVPDFKVDWIELILAREDQNIISLYHTTSCILGVTMLNMHTEYLNNYFNINLSTKTELVCWN